MTPNINYVHSTENIQSLQHQGVDKESAPIWRRILLEALPFLKQFGTNEIYIKECTLEMLQNSVRELMGQTEIARTKKPWRWVDILDKGPAHFLFQGWGPDPREEIWDPYTKTRGLWHKESGLVLARTHNHEPQMVTNVSIEEFNLHVGLWKKKNLKWD